MSIDMPLDEFVETEEGRHYGAAYCDYFSGLGAFSDFGTSNAIDRAKRNLSLFAVVGFLDDLSDFRKRINREFGFRPRVGHKNKGLASKKDVGESISPATLDRIRLLCSPDREIFEFARNEFGR
jgi:hypothetical protein